MPELHAYLTDEQYFVREAEKRSRASERAVLDEAWGIIDQLGETLADYSILLEIEPRNIQFVTGKSFWNQNTELQTYGRAIEDFLFGMESQPPQIVSVLGGMYLGYCPRHNLEELSRILTAACEKVAFSQSDTAILQERLTNYFRRERVHQR